MDHRYRQFLADGQRVGSRYALSVPRGAPLGLAGARLGQRAGSSLEFMDYRDYQTGDDLRQIDWSAYARSDRLVVKLYREEVSPHLDLLIDGSCSMALAGSAKAQAALGLSALLATAAGNAGFTHRAHLALEGCSALPGGEQVPSAWHGLAFEARVDLAQALTRLPPAWRARSLRVLVSDLLFAADPLTVLSRLSQGAAALAVVQVLAQADVDPPGRGNLRLADSETQQLRDVFIDAAAQARYRQNLAQHQQNWHRACRQIGATLVRVVAEPLVTDWNVQDLVAAELLKVC